MVFSPEMVYTAFFEGDVKPRGTSWYWHLAAIHIVLITLFTIQHWDFLYRKRKEHDINFHIFGGTIRLWSVVAKISIVTPYLTMWCNWLGCVYLSFPWTLPSQEHRKLFGLNDLNAKFRYIELCRSLRTYGVSFFAVKVCIYTSLLQCGMHTTCTCCLEGFSVICILWRCCMRECNSFNVWSQRTHSM